MISEQWFNALMNFGSMDLSSYILEIFVIFICALELIFIFILTRSKKPKEDSWLNYTYGIKLLSFLLLIVIIIIIYFLAVLLVLTFMIIEYMIDITNFKTMNTILMIILVIALWISINYLITITIGQEEKPSVKRKTRSRRIKRR